MLVQFIVELTSSAITIFYRNSLYALVWQQRNICNLSGVKGGDWKRNSLIKLAFDEIVPRNPTDDKVKGGDHFAEHPDSISGNQSDEMELLQQGGN